MLKIFSRNTFTKVLLTLMSVPALAGGEGWTEDYEAAKTQAAEEGKTLLMDFTGSDWCGWCIKLDKEVFSKDAFKAYAEDNLVLVMLDYPRNNNQTGEVKAQNAALKDEFGIRGFPTIYLTDAAGLPYAKTGYVAGGPEKYIKHLEELKQKLVERDQHLDAAAAAEGIEKAKHLDKAMQALGMEMALSHYGETVKQIMDLDAENEAGLKKQYQSLYLAQQHRAAISEIMRGAQLDPAGAATKLDKLLEDEAVSDEVRQEALFNKAQIQSAIKVDKSAVKATLTAAVEADPESRLGAHIKAILAKHFADVE